MNVTVTSNDSPWMHNKNRKVAGSNRAVVWNIFLTIVLGSFLWRRKSAVLPAAMAIKNRNAYGRNTM
jgi:hypothetical protein